MTQTDIAQATGVDPTPAKPRASRARKTVSPRVQQRIVSLQECTDSVRQIAREFRDSDKAVLTDLNELLLAVQIHELLQDFNPGDLKQLLADKPEHFFKLASAITAQTGDRLAREKLELEYQKYRDHVAEQKRKIEEATHALAGQGLTPAVLAQIEQAASLL